MTWRPANVLGLEFETVLGLDLQGGLEVTLEAEPQTDEPLDDEQLERARQIIEPRVVTETAGDGSRLIRVEVPGVSDEAQIRRLVGSTGQLQFIDPQGQQLTTDQNIGALIEQGAVRVLFDGGEINADSVAPGVDGNQIGVSFNLSETGS